MRRMHSSDVRGQNLFSRLFTYAPRPAPDSEDGKRFRQRNALEDFCTEALAWCLRDSKPFADRLFQADCFQTHKFEPKTFEVDTQLSFTGEDGDEEDDSEKSIRSRFDLVLRSSAPTSFVIVIECKVAPDKRENIEEQIKTYKALQGDAFKSYVHRRIFLLTPYGEKYNADAHLSWDQVYDALGPEEVVLHQFGEFLKIQHLARMKLPSIPPLLSPLKSVAPMLAGLAAIFENLRNDDVGRVIFRKEAVVPKMNINKDENYFWYDIWSRGARPTYIVGFHTTFSNSDPLLMSVQVAFDGDRTSEVLSGFLKTWFRACHAL